MARRADSPGFTHHQASDWWPHRRPPSVAAAAGECAPSVGSRSEPRAAMLRWRSRL